ncbi:bifunctional diguanylate cyclase/phosphodiesterase [Rhizobium sp. SSA_523]|uniref:putative bifunctional diguanylate cyclase/phosphodiesterase n=1 Tax=Rhizobium sp. SSA_523 TaxID=2952477 RepID=UPI0020902069|nr:bifunctional diguanylate cyclase/phosphodiesterase [Rhizobium sp. SSA_523]MCO5730326.1 bifunctional diguanylate cyclase/phosphodiesterase [Rhizobium sp. SSA_523]WKC25375.1 bifunctional diguanylate cyclase/phosphodiesterase [Rhizobium sp. SSA_523]
MEDENALGIWQDDAFVSAIARMQESVRESDVLRNLHLACEVVAGPLRLLGVTVCHDGKTVLEKADYGSLPLPPDLPSLECFLAHCGIDTEGDVWRPDGEPAMFGRSLCLKQKVVGRVALFGPGLKRQRAVRHCAQVIRLCATALAGFRQRRLAQMVLEALEESHEAISFYDEKDGIVFTNPAYHRVFPHYPEPAKLLGRTHLDLYRLDLEAGIIDDPLAIADPEAYLAERAHKAKSLVGHQREIQKIGSRTYIYTRSRSKTGATMSRRIDITEQIATEAQLREREAELRTIAFRDALTGLHNRAFLRDYLARLQTEAACDIAGFVIDLDGFKLVNDSYGHDLGDHILQVVAQRLLTSVPQDDLVIRLGGDEFVALLTPAPTRDELAALAGRIVCALQEPILHEGVAMRVGVSIGIHSGSSLEAAELISDADIAMYEMKKKKRSGFAFFEPAMRLAVSRRIRLTEDIRAAIAGNAFELYYQPQYSSRDHRVVGCEALARWKHATEGFISPEIFIPIIEEEGLIEGFGEWVLRAACQEAVQWPDWARVAVNVSPLQLSSGRFPAILADVLSSSGLRPDRLELEITESVFLGEEASTRAQLEQWKALGVRIALDDFGYGYSSLGYLTSFPIDKIKIDRRFLGASSRAESEARIEVIVPAIISLAQSLGMAVTAEGVEHPEQAAYLADHSCGELQGYLLGKPMPAAEARSLFEKARAERPRDAGSTRRSRIHSS